MDSDVQVRSGLIYEGPVRFFPPDSESSIKEYLHQVIGEACSNGYFSLAEISTEDFFESQQIRRMLSHILDKNKFQLKKLEEKRESLEDAFFKGYRQKAKELSTVYRQIRNYRCVIGEYELILDESSCFDTS